MCIYIYNIYVYMWHVKFVYTCTYMHINMHIYVGEDLLHFKPMPKVCAMSKVIVLLLSVESLLMDRCHMSYSPIDLIHRSMGRPCRNTKKGHSGHGLVFFHDILQLIWSALDQLFEPNKGDGSRGLLRQGGYPSRQQNVAWDVLCKWCLMGK